MKKHLTCCADCQRMYRRKSTSEVFVYTLIFFAVIFAIGKYFWT